VAQMKARILSVAVMCFLTTAAWAGERQPSAATEEPSSTLVGKRVRLSGPSLATRDEPFIGQATAVDAESITVVKNTRTGETRRIPFSSIKRLDVARPGVRGSRAGAGLLTGMALPIAASVLAFASCSPTEDLRCYDTPGRILVYGVPIGAVVGAVVGGFAPAVRWERVDTRRVRVSVLPDFRGGVRGGLSVRF